MSERSVKQIEQTIFFTLVFLFPLIVIPSFSNPFVTPKLIILALLLSFIYLIKAVKSLFTGGKGLIFHTGTFDVPVALIVFAYVVSGLTTTPNKMEAFWLPGTASFVLGGGLVYFIVNQLGETNKRLTKIALMSSATTIAFITVLAGSGVLKIFTTLPSYFRSEAFSTMGSALSAGIFMAVVLPFAINFVFKSANMGLRAVSGVMSALIGIALVISIFTILKNWGITSLPGLSNSWNVATETLKNQPLFGAGPGNYLSAFSKYIPLTYNQTDRWSLRFSNAQNYYLTVTTETGLIGFAAFVVLLFAVYKKIKSGIREENIFEHLPILILLVAFLFFPVSAPLVILLFILLSIESRTHIVNLFARENEDSLEGKIANVIVAVPTIALSLFVIFLTFKATQGEIIYQKSLSLVAAQDGKGAYDTIRGAIQTSPYADRYHVTYAQLNLALANSIAQKKSLTEDDKNTVSQLVQQAIREGRAAVVLNPQRDF